MVAVESAHDRYSLCHTINTEVRILFGGMVYQERKILMRNN